MKEWICKEVPTSTRDAENGILMMETELIRCKDCMYWTTGDGMQWNHCPHLGIDTDEYFYCREAEKKETGYFTPEERKFYKKVNREKMQDIGRNIFDFMRRDKYNKGVPLHHEEDIHFNSEEGEKAFYEALAEREDEHVTTNDKTIRND